jgi:uncharacterized protein (DUF433 family)
MGWRDRIGVDPGIAFGKPVVKGTRLAVDFIIDLLAHGCSFDEILENYPQLTREDILACLAYAGELASEQIMYPLAAR